MAVRVAEHDVFAAADAVLSCGERPTVERVRKALGRGSPKRVGSLLDQWWARLAERLGGETRLPNLPPQLSQRFIALWEQAVQQANGIAEQSLLDQRQMVAKERAHSAAVELAARQEVTGYCEQATAAIAGQQAAERRIVDLQRILEQNLQRIGDLIQQREELKIERDTNRARVQDLERQLLSDRSTAEQARKAQEGYIRGAKDRANQEVDRAREEAKNAVAELTQHAKQSAELQHRLDATGGILSQLQHRLEAQEVVAEAGARKVTALEKKAAKDSVLLECAQRTAAIQQARADALEEQARGRPSSCAQASQAPSEGCEGAFNDE